MSVSNVSVRINISEPMEAATGQHQIVTMYRDFDNADKTRVWAGSVIANDATERKRLLKERISEMVEKYL